MGNRLSQRCSRASSGRPSVVSIMLDGDRGGGRERELRARKGNALLLEKLFDAVDIRADDPGFSNHQGLVPIADVVRVEPPLLGRARFDQEHRLRSLNDDDDGLRLLEDQAVTAPQHRAAREQKTEGDSAVRPPPSVYAQSVVPSERDRVARVAANRDRQRVVGMDLLDDDQNRKYRWASGSTSAGSLVSS